MSIKRQSRLRLDCPFRPLIFVLSLLLILGVLPEHALAVALTKRQLPLPPADVPHWRTALAGRNAEFYDSNGNNKQCMFYYRVGGLARIYSEANANNPPNYPYGRINIWRGFDAVNDMEFMRDPLRSWAAAGQHIPYFQAQSQAFAERCVGPAQVMLAQTSPNEPNPDESIWTAIEYKIIKGTLDAARDPRRSGVTSIRRITTNNETTNPTYTDLGQIWPNGPAFSGKRLRIMPMGDSITAGVGDPANNGYRKPLYDQLSSDGNTVEMVGNAPPAGNFPQSRNEGYSGITLAGLQDKVAAAVKLRPNVILLHIGTNDVNSGTDVSTLPARLGNLIDSLFSGCPDAVIIVARIIRNKDSSSATQARVIKFNNEIIGVVSSRASNGKKVFTADMFEELAASDLADSLHPNPTGYAKMAFIWLKDIRWANEKGWIGTPATIAGGSGGGKQQCTTSAFWYPANGDAALNTIANGAGYGNNIWPPIKCGDYIDENSNDIKCACSTTGRNYLVLKGNTPSCDDHSIPYPHALHMVDLSGDGRADFVYVGDIGQVKAYYSVADPNGNADKIIWYDQGTLATGIGCKREQIHFADIDGDGRADYLCVRPDSSVTGYRNTFFAGKPGNINWIPYGDDIATGIGRPGGGVRFADLSGDGRADYLYVHPNGAVDAYQNQPKAGDPTKPSWLPQTNPIATGVGSKRENIIFADIDGDGRADYLSVSHVNGATTWNRNMFSKDNGPNAATPIWDGQKSLLTGVGTNGIGIQFADLNGDGRADFIDVDPNTSAARAYFNGCNA